ncbi:MAG: 16S rRNA (uracil(1498)-N(3))-methyltransferase [Myxococcota bacterium]
MNCILLEESDMRGGSGRVRLTGRRGRHVREVHRVAPGDALRVGLLGGRLGSARVLRVDDAALELAVRLDRDPPPRLPLRLVLALPRPRVLRRVLVAVASLGVEELVLLNSWRVEKSYWQSDSLDAPRIEAQLRLGLELAGDTRLPRVRLERLFRPFVEGALSEEAADRRSFVAHPAAPRACPRGIDGPATLAVGPEGGFIQAELDSFGRAGFETVCLGGALGDRVLGVETAVAALVSRLF